MKWVWSGLWYEVGWVGCGMRLSGTYQVPKGIEPHQSPSLVIAQPVAQFHLSWISSICIVTCLINKLTSHLWQADRKYQAMKLLWSPFRQTVWGCGNTLVSPFLGKPLGSKRVQTPTHYLRQFLEVQEGSGEYREDPHMVAIDEVNTPSSTLLQHSSGAESQGSWCRVKLPLWQWLWYRGTHAHTSTYLSWNVLPNWLVLIASCSPKFLALFGSGSMSSKTFTTGFCLNT